MSRVNSAKFRGDVLVVMRVIYTGLVAMQNLVVVTVKNAKIQQEETMPAVVILSVVGLASCKCDECARRRDVGMYFGESDASLGQSIVS